MRVAVFGTGGVGGYFGARLAESGVDVMFIARGAHLAKIRENGLGVLSPNGDMQFAPGSATDDPAEIGPVDYVLFTTKHYDVATAGPMCRPLLGPDTAVISLLNGVTAPAMLAEALGPQHVVGGVAQIGAEIAEPGVIRHHTPFATMIIGEPDGRISGRLEAFKAACDEARFDCVLSGDIELELWKKFVFLASSAAISSLSRQSIGGVRHDPELYALLEDALREAIAVGRASGVALPDDAYEQGLAIVGRFAPELRPSMATDLLRGNRLEVEWFSGHIYREGRRLGVPTPVHRVVYAALKPFADGVPPA